MTAARRIADESARYNLGPIVRNFNMPATVLQFLHPDRQARFTFRKNGETKNDGRLEWTVVPAEMRERYEGPWGVGSDDLLMRLRYTVTGVAVYSNVRRANVDVRLIVAK